MVDLAKLDELIARVREAAIDIRNDGTPSQVGLTEEECLSVASLLESLSSQVVEAWEAFGPVPRDKSLAEHTTAALDELAEIAAAAESRATAAEGRVALLGEERDELRKIIAAFVQRFELYAGPNDMHAGKHDLELLTLGRARARLAKGGQ